MRRTYPVRVNGISIHALLAESDELNSSWISSIRNFYPRSPCGERPWQRGSRITYVEISIHALLAESDSDGVVSGSGDYISIHALLAESDVLCRGSRHQR